MVVTSWVAATANLTAAPTPDVGVEVRGTAPMAASSPVRTADDAGRFPVAAATPAETIGHVGDDVMSAGSADPAARGTTLPCKSAAGAAARATLPKFRSLREAWTAACIAEGCGVTDVVGARSGDGDDEMGMSEMARILGWGDVVPLPTHPGA